MRLNRKKCCGPSVAAQSADWRVSCCHSSENPAWRAAAASACSVMCSASEGLRVQQQHFRGLGVAVRRGGHAQAQLHIVRYRPPEAYGMLHHIDR
ncbi:MAG: hypothetical protein P8141_00590 [Gammaproteobacteria bacterium]